MQTDVPNQWQITLKSGNVLGLVADSYGRQGDFYVFDILVEATEEEQANDYLMITAETPSNPQQIMIAVASVPVADVKEIVTGKWKVVPTSA